MTRWALVFGISDYQSVALHRECHEIHELHDLQHELKIHESVRYSFAPQAYLLFHALDTHLSKTIKCRISTYFHDSSTLDTRCCSKRHKNFSFLVFLHKLKAMMKGKKVLKCFFSLFLWICSPHKKAFQDSTWSVHFSSLSIQKNTSN